MKLRVYNKTLDPNIWNEDKTLKPDVKDVLLKIAEDFYNSTDLKDEIQNILFLGSSANYNWTPTSDIDLHVVIDIAGEKIHDEYARKFMEGLSFKWNTEHSLEVKGHPVEIYLQDVREPNSTAQQARPGAAIYSLFDDKWMLEPNPQNIKLDADKIRKKFHQLRKRIDSLIETQNIDQMKKLMKSIRNYRDAGLAEGGEFSIENLVFKALRHSGDLAKLKDTITKLYDQNVSLPEGGNIKPHKKTEPLSEVIGDRPFLIVGSIDGDLEVKSKIDYVGASEFSHDAPVIHGIFDSGISWRYKSKTNTIYWSDTYIEEKEKDAVLDHLHNKYNVVNPRHSYNDEEYISQGHFINEDLIRKDANLYLGFINRENFKVIGTDVHDEGLTHNQWQQTLPKEYQWYYGSEALLWRYKREPNTVYWWSTFPEPTEDEKQYVDDWLFKHANIKYPKHQMISWLKDPESIDQRISAHTFGSTGEPYNGLDESVENFLVVGLINNNLEIVAEIDEIGNINHEEVLKNHPEFDKGGINDLSFWRYKASTNTLTWLIKEPADQQRHSVVEYLRKEFSVSNPKQIMGQFGDDSYKVNESINKLVRWIFTKKKQKH